VGGEFYDVDIRAATAIGPGIDVSIFQVLVKFPNSFYYFSRNYIIMNNKFEPIKTMFQFFIMIVALIFAIVYLPLDVSKTYL